MTTTEPPMMATATAASNDEKPQQDGDHDEKPQQNGNGDVKPQQPEASPAPLRDDWGREFAPPGWRERAERMLKSEYQHFPEAAQQRLKKSYASFYEFLVENPFVDSVTKMPIGSSSTTTMNGSTLSNGDVPPTLHGFGERAGSGWRGRRPSHRTIVGVPVLQSQFRSSTRSAGQIRYFKGD